MTPQEEKQIFKIASKAYFAGKTQDDNPFKDGTKEHEAWRLGWHEEYAYWET
jgi:hypothetical protein